MNFKWEKTKKPIVTLAPMAGYTDSAYRQIVKKITPEIICFSELTSVNAINHENEKTMKMLDFEKNEYPLIMQLFGKDPKFFIEAAKKLENLGIAGIDINMGCPARKIIHAEQGSALIKNPDLAIDIVHKLSIKTKLPVSVKTRIGYEKYEPKNLIKFCKNLEKAGAKLITLHGRTTKQGFSGKAEWEPIYLIKKNLKIPVIGNGDITSAEIAKNRLTSPDKKITLDGIMIGRASFGNPWIMAKTYAKLHNKKYNLPDSYKEKIPLIKEHLFNSIRIKGKKHGIIEMRKHLSAYIKDFKNASKYRQKILQTENADKILSLLDQIAETS